MISHRGSHTTMRARANTAMAPNDDRGDDTCESDRIAPDARRTDSEHPDSDTPLEPITSNEELERSSDAERPSGHLMTRERAE